MRDEGGDRKQDGDVARPRDRELVGRMMRLFELDDTDSDRFRAPGMRSEPRRIFGGQLVAQALAAATRTVSADRRAHSLHAYFMRAGVTTSPLDFAVTRDVDGGRLSFRRVVVTQDGLPLLSLAVSFQTPAQGLAHQIVMPAVPAPDTLEDDHLQAARCENLSPAARAAIGRASPFQFRSINLAERYGTSPSSGRQQYWFRVSGALAGIDQASQRIVLTYASDMMLLGAGLMPHGLRWFDGETRVASIDHALWIYGDVQMDDWLLADQEATWTAQGRGLNRGHIFHHSGRLVASVAQEGSIRTAERAGDVE